MGADVGEKRAVGLADDEAFGDLVLGNLLLQPSNLFETSRLEHLLDLDPVQQGHLLVLPRERPNMLNITPD